MFTWCKRLIYQNGVSVRQHPILKKRQQEKKLLLPFLTRDQNGN